ncbi:MAG: RNA polymerase sigma factor [Jatrophihabitans sp.]|uniref:RNA polymerase sigma factor n=1 Tax=Jatrophihabitans sp. TaxID=1932789 RepID=UPI003F8207F0
MADDALDEATVAAATRGEPAALRAVYDALAPVVQGYLRAKGVRDADAVTQDVFLALLPKLPHLRGGSSGLRRLTFSIAHARIADDHRSRAREPQWVPYEAHDDERRAESAEQGAEARLATEAVLAALRVLPADHQEVLGLRIVADLSLEETAAVLGRSVGAVKQLQRRALLALKAALAERKVTL